MISPTRLFALAIVSLFAAAFGAILFFGVAPFIALFAAVRPEFDPALMLPMIGAITLVNLTGWTWGVAADETGINIESFEPTVRPEFKEFAFNRQNEKIGFAVGEPETEISIEGETTGTTGLMAATFTAAVTLGNTFSLFGSAGKIYMDEVTLASARGAYRRFSARFSRNKGIDPA